MKRKNKGKGDGLNRTHYSAAQNVCYCLRSTAQCAFPLLCWCALAILTKTVLTVLLAYLPKTIIEGITAKSSLPKLAAAVLALAGCIALLSGVDKFFTRFIYHQKFNMNTFYLRRVALKGLCTDYCNQEDGTFRKLQAESFSCCNGNYSALTRIYDVLIDLFSGVLGVSAFGVILARLYFPAVIFLVLTTAAGYLLNRRIIQWIADNDRERIGYRQRTGYINTASGDIRSAKDIRLYRMAQWFSDIYQENMDGIAGWYGRLRKKLFGVAVGDGGLALLREGAVMAYLIGLLWKEQLSVADFVLYSGIAAGFSSWLGSIFSQVASLDQLSQKINYLRSYLEYPEAYRQKGGMALPADGLPKTIELKNVSYRYEGAKGYALKDIQLKIAPGEHLALVGLNGAGKTTLVKLICGLIDPVEGQVLYDGVDIRAYNRTDFYKLFSAVFQQFSLMPVSIEEMVSETPAEQADHERVRSCLKAAGIWEKIERLPKALKTPFGRAVHDDGAEFSGGEVQKLLLARALYKSAPVMVLDEPTAALDPIAESRLYDNYHQISERKTALFISHRLASTRFCSRIILMENGMLCEEGTHQSLLERGGSYAALFQMQAKYYREKPDRTEVEE